jgi:hypothetical protein
MSLCVRSMRTSGWVLAHRRCLRRTARRVPISMLMVRGLAFSVFPGGLVAANVVRADVHRPSRTSRASSNSSRTRLYRNPVCFLHSHFLVSITLFRAFLCSGYRTVSL